MNTHSSALSSATYEGTPGNVKKALLLFSGGLDSSLMIPWLKGNYGCEVATFTADLGGGVVSPEAIKQKALGLGAVEAYCEDLTDEFAETLLAPAILANADYQGGYHLSCPLGRVLISKTAVRIAQAIGADAIAHGCTGKGNDQIRFDSYILTLAPQMKVIAPVRTFNLGRDEEYAYAKEHGIPVPAGTDEGKASCYSHDDNLWGFTAEGGDIEYPDRQPPMHEILRLCTPPEQAPDTPETVTITFEDGKPTELNGQPMKLVVMVDALNKLAGAHGVGFTILIEDRILGLKVRGVYENPAAHVLILAHRNLEKIVSTRSLLEAKAAIDQQWSLNVYDAKWFDPVMPPLQAFIDTASQGVSGTVTLTLFKGHALVTAVQSKRALFDANLATFDTVAEGAVGFNTAASAPFIELYSLATRQAHAIQHGQTFGQAPTPTQLKETSSCPPPSGATAQPQATASRSDSP